MLIIAGSIASAANEGCTFYALPGHTDSYPLSPTSFFTIYRCGTCNGPAQNTKCSSSTVLGNIQFYKWDSNSSSWVADGDPVGFCTDYSTVPCP